MHIILKLYIILTIVRLKLFSGPSGVRRARDLLIIIIILISD